MKSKFLKITIFIGLLLPLFSFAGLPSEALAKEGLVPCTEGCTVCNLFELVSRVIKFTIWDLGIPVAILMFMYGGIILLTAGGNENKVKQGQGVLTQTLIGLVIMLLAWLLINTIITSLAVSLGAKPAAQWYQFPTCQ